MDHKGLHGRASPGSSLLWWMTGQKLSCQSGDTTLMPLPRGVLFVFFASAVKEVFSVSAPSPCFWEGQVFTRTDG